MAILSNKIGAEIEKIFGIKHCKALTIHFSVNEIVTVQAEFYPEIDGIKQALSVIEKYKLVPLDDKEHD